MALRGSRPDCSIPPMPLPTGPRSLQSPAASPRRAASPKRKAAPGYGGYDSYESFSDKQKKEFQKWYESEYGKDQGGYDLADGIDFKPAQDYDDRLDHLIVFFNGIRTNSKIIEDASFGLRAAAPSIACNISAKQGKPINWDPVNMKLLGS